jgi:cation:H+ antiporter
VSLWFQLAICAAVILYAGSQLSNYADIIADKTGLSKGWIGLILLATITSLPELISSISAVTLHDLPDMAVSGTIGSCMFNMMIIGLLDTFSKKRPISLVIHQGHILSAGFGIVMMGFVAIDILFGKYLPILTKFNAMDPLSFAFVVVYLIAMKLIFSYERTKLKAYVAETAEALPESNQSLTRVIAIFTFNAVLIVVAACYLPALGEDIGRITGWGQSFIGSSFIAITTSLPELVVSFSAARRGSFDMAVANLLGSNLFNIVILSITDFCYIKAPLLRVVSQANTLTALTAMISMGIVVIALAYRSEKKIWILSGDAIALILVYVLANFLLFVAH